MMRGLILVTISNAFTFTNTFTTSSGHLKSASSLVAEREQEAKMDVSAALEAIQLNRAIPKEVMSILRPKRGLLRKAKSALVQQKQAPDEDTLRKLDKARLVLNKMYEEEQKELDV